MLYKKILAAVSAAAVCVSCLSVFAVNVSASDTPTAVRTAKELMNMKADGDYYLACDIDLSDVNWKPISGFYGTFDGGGYEITGMSSESYGLFSSLKSGAVVKDVMLTDVYITSKYKNVGAVASIIQSSAKNVTVDGCYVSGLVSSCRTKYGQDSASTAGSIIGINNSSSAVISNCYSNAVVASEKTVGGIVGNNRGTIKNCGFGGQLGSAYNIYELGCDKYGNKNEDYRYLYAVGGITGINYGKLSNSFSSCTRVDAASYYGGISGILNKSGSITYCVNSSDVPYDDFLTGGLICGYASAKSTVKNCYTKKPTNTTVSNDIGKGKKDSVTYGVAAEKYNKISSFKRLGSGWEILNGMPVLKSIRDYADTEAVYVIKGERLVRTASDEDDADVSFGYDEYGDILE